MARENLETANKLTLNIIQETLNIKTNKRDFLKMIFPQSLYNDDKYSLLDFIFCSDASTQSTRSIFINGNIIKNKKDSTYSRANQEVLSFIAEKMNDFSCFSDMIELVKKNFKSLKLETVKKLYEIDKNIYPVEFDKKLLSNFTYENIYKFLVMLILWSVYGERINNIHFENSENDCNSTDISSFYPYEYIMNYFQKNMINLDDIKSVDFSFLAGLRWIMDNERIDILQKLLHHNIQLNIILANLEYAELIGKHMRNPEKTYISFKQGYELWHNFYKKHKDLIKIKICSFPILRNYYSFNKKDGSSEIMFVMYTLNNPTFNKNYSQIIDNSSQYFQTLKNEFDYLWKNSEDMENLCF